MDRPHSESTVRVSKPEAGYNDGALDEDALYSLARQVQDLNGCKAIGGVSCSLWHSDRVQVALQHVSGALAIVEDALGVSRGNHRRHCKNASHASIQKQALTDGTVKRSNIKTKLNCQYSTLCCGASLLLVSVVVALAALDFVTVFDASKFCGFSSATALSRIQEQRRPGRLACADHRPK
ncbi:hypothetical protein R3P38DRAFT_2769149 [Favolaschia claudopus]|uniref:Uncharacterized protein n=1 Tax=Favolaschia claudopus TaxID=2862362 RepID=A0AAW0CQ17_9AGAR